MKKLNRKGFTLIELLAVIIILALIMVFAVPLMLNSANNAQVAAFQMYGQRVYNLTLDYLGSTQLLSNNVLDSNSGVLDLNDIGLRDNAFSGCIVYTKKNADETGDLQYDLTINLTQTNQAYCTATTVLSEANNMGIASNDPIRSSCPKAFVKSGSTCAVGS